MNHNPNASHNPYQIRRSKGFLASIFIIKGAPSPCPTKTTPIKKGSTVPKLTLSTAIRAVQSMMSMDPSAINTIRNNPNINFLSCQH